MISSGPYSYVRHAGYAAGIIMAQSNGIVLGWWVSLVPSVVGCAVLVPRTIVRDRILQAELGGYDQYARRVRHRRVRHRLVPGMW